MEQKNNLSNAATRTASPNGSSLKPSAAPFVPSSTPKPLKVTSSSFEPGKPYGGQSFSGSYFSPSYSQPYGGRTQGGLWIPPTSPTSPEQVQQAPITPVTAAVKIESVIPKEKSPMLAKVNKAIEIVDPSTKQPISLNKAIEIVNPTTNQSIDIRNSNNAVTKSTETNGENTKIPENENPKSNDKPQDPKELNGNIKEEEGKLLDKQENNEEDTDKNKIKSQEQSGETDQQDKDSPPSSKRTYSFDFLMSYKDNNKSTPEGMLIVDDLDPTKNIITPKKVYNNTGQWSHKKKIQTPIVIPRSENAWKRPEETGDEFVKFGRKVKNVLNKLTIDNFDEFCEKLEVMDISTTETKELMVNNIFEMAITQPNFAYMYALLCQRLASQLKGVEKDPKGTLEKQFRRLLVKRCQIEFEGREKPPVIGPEITNLEERFDLEEKSEKIRLKNLGTTKFIGELFRLNLISENIMHQCLSKLLGAGGNRNDEDLEHYVLLMTTIGKILDAKPGNLDKYFTDMRALSTKNEISYRIKCLLLNLDELKNNKWVPRRESETPKTIQEVHETAAKEEQERQFRERQLEKKLNRNPPKPKATPKQQKKVDADGWQEVTPTNKKPRNVPSKQSSSKQTTKEVVQKNRFNLLETNDTNKSQQQANNKNAGKNQRKEKNPPGQQEEPAAPKRPEYTLIQFEDKVDVILNEYLDSEDTSIAIKCVEDLQHPQFHNRVIEMTINKAVEACNKETAMITKLLGAFAKESNLFKPNLFVQTFKEILSLYDDIVIDVPKASMGLGYCLAHALLDKYLPPSILQNENFTPVTSPYEHEKIVASCFKELLAEDETAAKSIHKESQLGDFGQILKDGSTEENIKKFVASNSLENLFNPKSN